MNRYSAPQTKPRRAPERSAFVGEWQLQLLARQAYEASYTPRHAVIGCSFDSQAGYHAFASDRRVAFRATPNGLAYVPPGCEVYSQSCTGGEYLKITAQHSRMPPALGETPFSNRASEAGTRAAFALRRQLLSETTDLLACEQLLLTLVDCAALRPVKRNSRAAWMTTARFKLLDEYLTDKLAEPLSIAALARVLGVSAGFFSREFKRATGRSPHQYIVDRRLAQARLLMQSTALSLSTIALECGFSSHAHLSAQFRQHLGISPRQLKKSFVPTG